MLRSRVRPAAALSIAASSRARTGTDCFGAAVVRSSSRVAIWFIGCAEGPLCQQIVAGTWRGNELAGPLSGARQFPRLALLHEQQRPHNPPGPHQTRQEGV